MRVLLDTRVWLWMLAEPERLSEEGGGIVRDGRNELLLSAASTWEIAIEVRIGKLSLPGRPEVVVPQMLRETRVTPLAVEHSHTLRVAELPDHHRDPFDRLLVAQAQLEGVPVLTADAQIGRYDVEVLEA